MQVRAIAVIAMTFSVGVVLVFCGFASPYAYVDESTFSLLAYPPGPILLCLTATLIAVTLAARGGRARRWGIALSWILTGAIAVVAMGAHIKASELIAVYAGVDAVAGPAPYFVAAGAALVAMSSMPNWRAKNE